MHLYDKSALIFNFRHIIVILHVCFNSTIFHNTLTLGVQSIINQIIISIFTINKSNAIVGNYYTIILM